MGAGVEVTVGAEVGVGVGLSVGIGVGEGHGLSWVSLLEASLVADDNLIATPLPSGFLPMVSVDNGEQIPPASP